MYTFDKESYHKKTPNDSTDTKKDKRKQRTVHFFIKLNSTKISAIQGENEQIEKEFLKAVDN